MTIKLNMSANMWGHHPSHNWINYSLYNKWQYKEIDLTPNGFTRKTFPDCSLELYLHNDKVQKKATSYVFKKNLIW